MKNSFKNIVLAMTYFRIQLPAYYRLRYPVSQLCSEWEEVVPGRSDHQDNIFKIDNCPFKPF